ncbi:TonB-dependent receptor [Xanthovirga aplysinae]|uniref:TonB-dependent receptor n=1 Tax=Xanthovirga aplysinae TaxID=2529853 RepID=UPI001656F161|nr:carboxypeptidase-like regulatory domain-containing protein [Xanthovirga aplysinae]
MIGKIYDAENKQTIPFANIYRPLSKSGTTANLDGAYEIKTKKDSLNLIISAVGFQKLDTTLFLNEENTHINFYLHPQIEILNSIEIKASKEDSSIVNIVQSVTIKQSQIENMPSIGGEKDIITFTKLMPGISKGIEAGSDMFVRGGDADQNLVLLDHAVVYNPTHLLSFLSVFNPDVIDQVKLVKGGFHAKYGNRLASVLDVESIRADAEDYTIKGGIGLISSRLAYRQPLFKNKLHLQLAARRTYIDKVIKLINKDLPYYFYDLSGIAEFVPSDKNRIKFSYFLSTDVLKAYNDDIRKNYHSNFRFVNSIQSLNWTHIINSRFFSNLIFTRSLYKHKTWLQYKDSNINQNSSLNDINLGYHLTYQYNDRLKSDFGLSLKLYQFKPNQVNTSGRLAASIPDNNAKTLFTLENGLYYHIFYNLWSKITISPGLRISSVSVTNKTYIGFEPRLNLTYQVNERLNFSTSYTRMIQNMSRVSSTELSLPTDLWYPVSESIKPQVADQVTAGAQYKFPKIKGVFGMAVYLKNMNRLIDFKDGTDLTFNNNIEEIIVQGWGIAYGLELLLKMEAKKLSTWATYTLSRSERKFDEINHGENFPARYDRRHNFALAGTYKFHSRWAFSAVWEFQSGARFTPLTGQYVVLTPGIGGLETIPLYTSKNGVKLPDSHRMDLSLSFFTNPQKKFKGEWSINIYNVYNRAMPYTINVTKKPDGGLQYEQPGLFGLIPSISFNFQL